MASTKAYPPIIDPALLPLLPEEEDNEPTDPAVISKSCRLKPAHKVAGVCHKDTKGKKKAGKSGTSSTKKSGGKKASSETAEASPKSAKPEKASASAAAEKTSKATGEVVLGRPAKMRRVTTRVERDAGEMVDNVHPLD